MTGKYNLIDNKGVKVYPESPKTMRQSTADKKRDVKIADIIHFIGRCLRASQQQGEEDHDLQELYDHG